MPLSGQALMEGIKADYRALDPLVGLVWPVALMGRDVVVIGARGCVAPGRGYQFFLRWVPDFVVTEKKKRGSGWGRYFPPENPETHFLCIRAPKPIYSLTPPNVSYC